MINEPIEGRGSGTSKGAFPSRTNRSHLIGIIIALLVAGLIIAAIV